MIEPRTSAQKSDTLPLDYQVTKKSGYQTRSRAVLKPPNIGGEPCPTALWETRPCFTGPCLTFDWAVDDDGQLTCRRSDGVVVIGGCESKPRPCPVQCGSIQHAVCDPQSGVCQCELGYQQSDRGPCVLMAEVTMTTEPPLRHRHITETVAASEDEIQSRFYYPSELHPKYNTLLV
ncbi:unnamed protein product [Timema podura]|uniref:Uncharacterized protein n=1 Tax=Timema podura TaxID=61482 RepID=A0ABN7NS21_TIMPD|nr:unnamed protein product [Timema podura]